MSSHGWFTDLVIPRDSSVPGNPSAEYIAQGAHHAHHLAMYLSLQLHLLESSYLDFYIKKSLSADAWSKRLGFLYHWSQGKYYFDENYSKYLISLLYVLQKK